MDIKSVDELELQIRKIEGVIGVSFFTDDSEVTANLIVTPASQIPQAEDHARQIFSGYYEGHLKLQSTGIPPVPKGDISQPTAIFKSLFPNSIRLISSEVPNSSTSSLAIEANGKISHLNKSITIGNSMLESIKELVEQILELEFDQSRTAQRSSDLVDDSVDDSENELENNLRNDLDEIVLSNGIGLSQKRLNDFMEYINSCQIAEALVEPEINYSAKVVVKSSKSEALGVSKSYVKNDAEAMATLHAILRILGEFN